MILTVAAGAVNTGLTGATAPVIQNLGPGTLYFGPTPDDLLTEGLVLPAGKAYEYPAHLVMGSGALWIQAQEDSCDLRIVLVG
jgi:hypothetical protein